MLCISSIVPNKYKVTYAVTPREGITILLSGAVEFVRVQQD